MRKKKLSGRVPVTGPKRRKVEAVYDKFHRLLRGVDGVRHVSFGLKRSGGAFGYEGGGPGRLAVIVDVDRKWSEGSALRDGFIPAALAEAVPTDIREPVRLRIPLDRAPGSPPASAAIRGGLMLRLSEAGTFRGYGTLGGVVRAGDGRAFGLTCAHVAYGIPPDQNAVSQKLAVRVTVASGGTTDIPVGPLLPAKDGNALRANSAGLIDVAVVPLPTDATEDEIDHIGRARLATNSQVAGVGPAQVVRKVGARTGDRDGVVIRTNAQVKASYGKSDTELTFDGVWEIGPGSAGPIADHGDSGSLALIQVNNAPRAAAVVFAVDEATGLSYAFPLTQVRGTSNLGPLLD